MNVRAARREQIILKHTPRQTQYSEGTVITEESSGVSTAFRVVTLKMFTV